MKRFKDKQPFVLSSDIVERICRDDIAVIGPRGSGKSRLLAKLAATRVAAGERVIVATSNEPVFGEVFSQSCFEDWHRCRVHFLPHQARLAARDADRDLRIALEQGDHTIVVVDDVIGLLSKGTIELIERIALGHRARLWLALERPSDFAGHPFVSRLLETRLRLFTLGATPPLSYVVEHRRYAIGNDALNLIANFAYPRAEALDFVLNRDQQAEIVRLVCDEPKNALVLPDFDLQHDTPIVAPRPAPSKEIHVAASQIIEEW